MNPPNKEFGGTMRVLFLCLLFIGCSSPAAVPLASPSGTFVVTTEIPGDEAGPTRRHCIRLKIKDVRTAREMTFQTEASNGQKWAIAWSPSEALVVYSSDIGTRAYDIKGGRIIERSPDNAERDLARTAYREKYGRQPPA
jgi:hypothetical protein